MTIVRKATHRSRGAMAITLALVLGMVLAACSSTASSSSSTSSVSSPSAKGPITIGGTLSLTGAFSGPGSEYDTVYKAWVSYINSHGGLLGRKVQLDILNDNSTPATAVADYSTLINQDHVDLVLAPYTTYVGAPIVPEVRRANKILFNGGFVGIKYFDEDKGWMFGTYTEEEPQYTLGVFKLLESMPAAQRPTKLAVLYDNNPFTVVDDTGYQGQGGVVGYAKEYGMKIVYSQEYPPGTTNFAPAISSAKAAGAQVLFELGLPNSEVEVAKAVYADDYKPDVFCLCGSEETTTHAWPSVGPATNGVMGTTNAWPSQGFPGLSRVTAIAKAHGDVVLPNYYAVAWAIMQVIQQAVEGAHTLNQSALRHWLLTHKVSTAVGSFTYKSNGTTPFSEIVTQTVNGKQQPVWPPSVATAKAVIPMP